MEDLKNFNEIFESIKDKQDATEIMVILRKINDLINKEQENFVSLCWWFKKLKEHFTNPESLKKTYFHGYENKSGRWYYERIIADFGLEDRTVNRMIQIANRFIEIKDDVVPKIRPAFLGYNKSKLFDLLFLSDAQIEYAMANKYITPDMSVFSIRNYIKSLKGTAKAEKVLEETTFNEEDIPMAFDPNTHYEFSYFDNKSKNQLVNICCEYQKAYFKLKERKQKSK